MGVIVSLDVLQARYIMVLDDSSGVNIVLTCEREKSALPQVDHTSSASTTLSNPAAPAIGSTATGRKIDLTGIDVGVVVKAKGGISTFREERQMSLERVEIVKTTNEEVAAWAENTTFHRNILDKAWIISGEDERRAKREAEGLSRERITREEKRQRKKEQEMTKIQTSKPMPKRVEKDDRVAKEREQRRKREEECVSRQKEEKERGKQRRDAERLERERLFLDKGSGQAK